MVSRISKLKALLPFLCALCVLCGSVASAFAQDTAELKLSVRRDWGYGGGDQIQGLFTLEALGPEDLVSATFLIDDQVISEVTATPFKVQIDTDKFPKGWHDLSVKGQTAAGRSLQSSIRRFEFVSASDSFEAAGNIIWRVGLGVGVVILVIFAAQFVPMLFGRRKSSLPLGATRQYGLKGGAICPKCQRPFGIHFLSLNLGLAVFDYCDHCGKWSVVRPARKEALLAAEQAELQMAQPITPMPQELAEEKLKRQVDESRFVDEV